MSEYKVEDLTLEEAQKIIDDAPESSEKYGKPVPSGVYFKKEGESGVSFFESKDGIEWIDSTEIDVISDYEEALSLLDIKNHINRIQGGAVKSQDIVKNPSHYQVIDGVETINIIAASMTVEMFKGYCLGNIIKYRMRAGNKDKLQQEIDKANFYKVLFEDNKHLCRGE